MAVRYDLAATGLPGNYRGSPPRVGGTGSGQGPSKPAHPPPVRNRRRWRGGGVTWSPTVVNLLVLIGIEIAIYVGLRYLFKTAHGG